MIILTQSIVFIIQVLMRQKNEREHVMCLLDIISVMIHPDDSKEVLFDSQASLPAGLFDRISDSCLLPAVASYLRNDSGISQL